MMLPLLLSLLCTPSHPGLAPTLPASAQEQEAPDKETPAKPKKKKFARLTSPMKKAVQAGMHRIEKGKKPEDIEAGVVQVIAVGEAAVPSCLAAVKRMEKVERLDPLWKALDGILVDQDLPLAWKLLKKKSPDSLRIHLLRRWADSELEDAQEFLAGWIDHENPDLAYEAARGLARRGLVAAVPAIEAQVVSYWNKEAARLRADFAGVERGPLVAAILPLLRRSRTKEKLAGIRMFELFGVEQQIRLIAPFLSESDTTLRLAAINACRVVVAKQEPLERPSMTEIIERAEAWKAKL